MGKLKTPQNIIKKIEYLRSRGHSVPEIALKINKSKSIVSRYIQGVEVLSKYKSILESKKNTNKIRSESLWSISESFAQRAIGKLNKRDKIILLAGIYWGEGTKRELNIINSDPVLLKGFLDFIKEIGVSRERIKASVRIYADINPLEAISYWSKILILKRDQFFKTEVIEGAKKGKLQFGMCRLRVEKSSKEFKLLISYINAIKKQIMPL